VTTLAYSPDGRRLATGDTLGRVRVWILDQTGPSGPPIDVRLANDRVLALAFSRDGRRLAAGGDNHWIRVWDFGSLPPRELKLSTSGDTHRDIVTGLAFAADGRLVSVARNGSAIVWKPDPGGGSFAASPTIEIPEGTAATVSPDGRRIALGNNQGGLGVWDLAKATPELLFDLEDEAAKVPGTHRLAFSSDGRFLGQWWEKTLNLRYWNLFGKPTEHRLTEDGPIEALEFSPDGESIAIATTPGRLKLRSTGTGQSTASAGWLDPSGFGVTVLKFRPDGGALAVAVTQWREIEVRESKTLSVTNTLLGLEAGVGTLAFRPDGRTLSAADTVGLTRVWDLASVAPSTAEPAFLTTPAERSARNDSVGPNGHWLVSREGERARIWDLAAGDIDDSEVKPIGIRWEGRDDDIVSATFDATGNRIAFTGSAPLEVFELPDRRVRVGADLTKLFGLRFSPNGRWVAGWRGAREIMLVPVGDEAGKKPVHALSVPMTEAARAQRDSAKLLPFEMLAIDRHSYDSIVFDPKGRWLAARLWRENSIWFWDLLAADPEKASEWKSEARFQAFEFSPSGDWILAGKDAMDGPVRLAAYRLPSGPETVWPVLPVPPGYSGNQGHIRFEFSPDGSRLAVDAREITWVWQSTGPPPWTQYRISPFVSGAIGNVAISPDSRWLLADTPSGGALLVPLSLKNFTDPSSFVAPGAPGVDSLSRFSPDSRRLAATAGDATVVVAEIADLVAPREPGEPAPTPRILPGVDRPVEILEFVAGKDRLVVQGKDGQVKVWRLGYDELMDVARRTAGRNLTKREWDQYFPGLPYRETFPNLPKPLP
jgi:WD40 repeat protein